MHFRITRFLRFGVAVAALQLSIALAYSQVLYGTIVGNISDLSNQSVPNAIVVVTNTQTGVSATVGSNAAGDYEVHNLTPGVYRVKISAPGFASVAVDGLDVSANVTARADEHLKLSSVEQTVEVSASTSVMQTDSGTIHGELTATELTNVPIGGFNNYQSLLSLLPGATPSRFQNSVMDTPSRSLTTNINGSSRTGNVTSVDGAAIQQVYLPQHTLYNPPTEDIQSVDIVTNAFTAEQGLAGGAVVSVLNEIGYKCVSRDFLGRKH